jgi:hypothetical protein
MLLFQASFFPPPPLGLFRNSLWKKLMVFREIFRQILSASVFLRLRHLAQQEDYKKNLFHQSMPWPTCLEIFSKIEFLPFLKSKQSPLTSGDYVAG